MKKLLLLAVLVTLLAGAAYWLLSGRLLLHGNPTNESPAPALPTVFAHASELASKPSPRYGGSSQPERTAPDHIAPPPHRSGLRIKVCDQAYEPVANAIVTIEGDPIGLTAPRTGPGGYTQTTRFPSATVRIQAVDQIGAATGSPTVHRSGQVRWTYRESDVRAQVSIMMRPDREVHVSVVDEQGDPSVNVPVTLVRGLQHYSGPDDAQAHTNERGVATFAVRGSAPLSSAKRIRALATIAERPSYSKAVAWPEQLPDRSLPPTRLQVAMRTPAAQGTAKLTVRVVDPSGASAAVDGLLSWSHHVPIGSSYMVAPIDKVRVSSATTTISGLAPGSHLTLKLQESGRLDCESEVQMPPGLLRHTITLQQSKMAPVLEIPCVDAHGTAITEATFALFLQVEGTWQPIYTTERPDQRGVLRVMLPNERAGKVEISVQHRPDTLVRHATTPLARPYSTMMGRGPVANPVVAIRSFGAAQQSGEPRRLNPVVVTTPRILLRGQVITQDGKPVAGATVLISSTTAPEPQEFKDFRVATDPGGHFKITACDLPDEVFVAARSPFLFAPPVRVSASAKTIQLTMRPTGTVELGVRGSPHLLDMRTSRSRFGLRAIVALTLDAASLRNGWWMLFREGQRRAARSGRQVWTRRSPVQPNCDVVFEDLIPGNYELRSYVNSLPGALLVDALVAAGRTTRPKQLEGRLLGTDIEEQVVRVTDTTGSPVNGAQVLFEFDNSDKPHRDTLQVKTDHDGRASLAMRRGMSVDVMVRSPGYADWRRKQARRNQEVRLLHGTDLAFEIQGWKALTGAVRGSTVCVADVAEHPGDSPILGAPGQPHLVPRRSDIDPLDGHARLPNVPPGTYRLWFVVYALIDPQRQQEPMRVLDLGRYTVTADGPASHTVRHVLTTGEIARLRGEAR